MAGLPGTGKSTIARELAPRLNATVLNKDEIRARLFSPETVDYSRRQDDLCMAVLFVTAGYLLNADPGGIVIIDGRTFSKTYQVHQLLRAAQELMARPGIIECVCDDEVVRQRLDQDQQTGVHPAANRSFQLHIDLKQKAEPITIEHLVIDTGKEPLEKCVERCLAYLGRA